MAPVVNTRSSHTRTLNFVGNRARSQENSAHIFRVLFLFITFLCVIFFSTGLLPLLCPHQPSLFFVTYIQKCYVDKNDKNAFDHQKMGSRRIAFHWWREFSSEIASGAACCCCRSPFTGSTPNWTHFWTNSCTSPAGSPENTYWLLFYIFCCLLVHLSPFVPPGLPRSFVCPDPGKIWGGSHYHSDYWNFLIGLKTLPLTCLIVHKDFGAPE